MKLRKEASAAICCEDYASGEVLRRLWCGHKFHLECCPGLKRDISAGVQEGDEQCRVLGLRAGESLLVLLFAERSTASAELLTGLSEVALPLLRPIAQSTAAELSDAKQWHIQGYR